MRIAHWKNDGKPSSLGIELTETELNNLGGEGTGLIVVCGGRRVIIKASKNGATHISKRGRFSLAYSEVARAKHYDTKWDFKAFGLTVVSPTWNVVKKQYTIVVKERDVVPMRKVVKKPKPVLTEAQQNAKADALLDEEMGYPEAVQQELTREGNFTRGQHDVLTLAREGRAMPSPHQQGVSEKQRLIALIVAVNSIVQAHQGQVRLYVDNAGQLRARELTELSGL